MADDRQWAALAALAAGEAWAADETYATAAGRIARRDGLDRALAAWTAGQDRDGLVARLRQAGVASSPVQSIEEVWADPQFAARAMKRPVDLPALGAEELFRAPWLLSGTAPVAGRRGPMLGEHNEPVLKGILGLSDEEFDRLKAEEVIL